MPLEHMLSPIKKSDHMRNGYLSMQQSARASEGYVFLGSFVVLRCSSRTVEINVTFSGSLLVVISS